MMKNAISSRFSSRWNEGEEGEEGEEVKGGGGREGRRRRGRVCVCVCDPYRLCDVFVMGGWHQLNAYTH